MLAGWSARGELVHLCSGTKKNESLPLENNIYVQVLMRIAYLLAIRHAHHKLTLLYQTI